MSTLNKLIGNYRNIKSVISDDYDNAIPENKTSQYKADRKRVWSTIYLIVASFVGSIIFLVCWVYAYFSWGFWPGVCLGWIPSLIIGITAGLIWPLVVFILLIYMFFLQYTGRGF